LQGRERVWIGDELDDDAPLVGESTVMFGPASSLMVTDAEPSTLVELRAIRVIV
jgi:hypothetical protein